jgi:3D (Asp-Asp-Asp) domain-containing protein
LRRALILALLLLALTPQSLAVEPILIKQPVISSEVSRGQRVLIMQATAYCYTGHKTKTGTWPKEGRTVAVDPSVIPLGSRLVIDGVGGYIAEDTGGAIKGRIIDLYMTDRTDCIKHGRQTVEVRVVE